MLLSLSLESGLVLGQGVLSGLHGTAARVAPSSSGDGQGLEYGKVHDAAHDARGRRTAGHERDVGQFGHRGTHEVVMAIVAAPVLDVSMTAATASTVEPEWLMASRTLPACSWRAVMR
jgi:hypothetical protein